MRNLCGDHEQTPLTLKVFTIFKLSSKQCGNNKHPQRTGRLFVLQQKNNYSESLESATRNVEPNQTESELD